VTWPAIMLKATSWPTVSSPSITRVAPAQRIATDVSLPISVAPWLARLPSVAARKLAVT